MSAKTMKPLFPRQQFLSKQPSSRDKQRGFLLNPFRFRTSELDGDPYWENVVALLHLDEENGSTTIIDSSPLALPYSRASGTGQITNATSKFGDTSLYVDGNTRYLSPYNSAWVFGTNDFTVEFFYYRGRASATWDSVVGNFASSTSWCLWVDSNEAGKPFFALGAAGMKATSPAIPVSTWTHIAVSRNAGWLRMFINGELVTEGSFPQNLATPNPIAVGGNGTGFDCFLGNIAELRITKGVGRYTENFSVPTEPYPISTRNVDPHFGNVVALLKFDGANGSTSIVDVTGRTWTANGNAEISSDTQKFGNSLLCDGTGDYVSSIGGYSLSVGGRDHTIEAWIRLDTLGRIHTISNKRRGSDGYGEHSFQVIATNKLQYAAFNVASAIGVLSGTTELVAGQWYFVSVSRQSANWYMHLDGVLEASTTTATSAAATRYTTAPLSVGRDNYNTSRDLLGMISEYRFTMGVGRYGGYNYAPPIASFPGSYDSFARWSADDCHPTISLNERMRQATNEENWRSVRAMYPKSSGKFYLEWQYQSLTAVGRRAGIGVGNASAAPDNFTGATADSWALLGPGGGGYLAGIYNNNVPVSEHASYQHSTLTRGGMAVDLDNHKIWWSLDGVFLMSGDPVAGTTPGVSDLPAGDYSIMFGGENTASLMIYTKPSEWRYTPPIGFEAWAA